MTRAVPHGVVAEPELGAPVLKSNTDTFAPVLETGNSLRRRPWLLWIGASIAASVLVGVLLSRSAQSGPATFATVGSDPPSAIQAAPKSLDGAPSLRLPGHPFPPLFHRPQADQQALRRPRAVQRSHRQCRQLE